MQRVYKCATLYDVLLGKRGITGKNKKEDKIFKIQ